MSGPIMSQPVTIPIFGSASNQQPTQQQQAGGDWYMEDGGDQDMDFDLLAEYLLEENPGTSQTGFDFK